MSDQIIFTQLQQLPDALKKEVIDFIGYLVEKHKLSSQHTGTPKQPKKGKANKAEQELEEAIKVVRAGCDMSSFGDALKYQTSTRQERKLPYRD